MATTLVVNADMKSSGAPPTAPAPPTTMTIGELAGRFGLATHVLRHWESAGLLEPARDTHGRRRYDAGHITRVAVVLRAKAAGLALDDIRELLRAGDPAVRRQRLEAHREELRRRVAEAQACLDLVECALGCAHDDLADCPRFREAVAATVGGAGLPVVAATTHGEDLPTATGAERPTRWYGP
ncbi:MerR family transcriptional regulator [Streptomyces sp. NPDC056194]|uniref:MerR family transcriptional regulator n=2 Tax=unclassified Streptomyces TaxID=2593676 RepID=UPI0035E19F09